MSENSDDILSQKDTSLQTLLSSLSRENLEPTVLLKCIMHMESFDIFEVDDNLFQWIMPSIKANLLKAFGDNSLMADTCDDDFVTNILRDNLKLILSLIGILRDILKFLIEKSTIQLSNIKHVGVTSIQVISLTLDHCKKSSEVYKINFNGELLEIFQLIQEAHTLFFQLFVSTVVVSDSFENNEELEVLLQVLETVCDVSEILYTLNIKLLTENWKGYLAITQKFLSVLKTQINIKRPIKNLIVVIDNSLSSLTESDAVNPEILSTRFKLSGFLVKVVLQIIEIFWEDKQKIIDDIIGFCCMIYSYTSPRFLMMNYPTQIISLVEDIVFSRIKSCIVKFLQDDYFIQDLANETVSSEKYPFGLINLLNVCFECMAVTEKMQISRLDVLIKKVFDSIKFCFQEFLWPESIFENLVINITGAIMVYNEHYKKIEDILLENILQEQIWNYFLASEIWCLLLRNANPPFCFDTLTNLIKIYDHLEFGNNSHRLEKIYLKYLMQRVYQILPDYLKRNANSFVWKKINFKYFPKQMKTLVNDLHQITLDKIDELGTETFTPNDLVLLADNLELLSNINFQEMCIDPLNLVNALEGIWELTFTDTDNNNNLYKYFIAKVFKITSSLAKEFNNKQLYMVLNKLTHLSSHDYFKLQISLTLLSFGLLNPNEIGQDGCKLFKMISNIIINLLQNSNIIVKQSVLEVLDVCEQNGKQNIIRDVVMNCNNMPMSISDYLKKRTDGSKFDAEHFKPTTTFEYDDTCVEWKKEVVDNKCKRIKLDHCDNSEININLSQQHRREENDLNDTVKNIETGKKKNVKYSLKEVKYKSYKKKNHPTEETENLKIVEDDNINDVLERLKGEVKCLTNVLKTEKMTAKNVSDLKIIASQLSSLI